MASKIKSMRRVRNSRFLAYILRHNPEKFSIKIDEKGFAKIDEIIKKTYLSYEDIEEILRHDKKGRYERRGDMIRATYGHSIEIKDYLPTVEPPEYLYHGTSRKASKKILENGLFPMGRRYVHLSVSEDDALMVGIRRDENPRVLKIKALEAYRDGIKFMKANKVYLVEHIPPRYIEVIR